MNTTTNRSPQRGLLVRVGIDSSFGQWNAPTCAVTNQFIYVPIPEPRRPRPGMARYYRELRPALKDFGSPLPPHLSRKRMHLDPDFQYLTYGDLGRKGQRIAQLKPDDLIVFYAGLRDCKQNQSELIYALIGLYVVERIRPANTLAKSYHHHNAHTRVIDTSDDEIVVQARAKVSGRLSHCIPIGSRRAAVNRPNGTPMYRVLPELLDAWGGLSNNDGYLQRSAVPPEFADPVRFYRWFQTQRVQLHPVNN